jgi:serine/threonine protein kinase
VLRACLQGSLRDALDCGLLSKPGSHLAPSVVLTLAHDICAAMLHLHRCVLRGLRRSRCSSRPCCVATAAQLCHSKLIMLHAVALLRSQSCGFWPITLRCAHIFCLSCCPLHAVLTSSCRNCHLPFTLSATLINAVLCSCSEGIVHADLKAANVMLTSGGDDVSGTWGAASGAPRMTAKVADFGLALPLDPSDTHATLSARVSDAMQLAFRITCVM